MGGLQRFLKRIKMAAKTLLLNVSGMTCGKCEKIIREGIMEDVKEVKNVEVDRPESKVTVEIQTEIAEQFDEKKEQILSIVNSLVNGKFTATVVDSVKIVPSSNEFTLWKEFDELQDSEDAQDKFKFHHKIRSYFTAHCPQ